MTKILHKRSSIIGSAPTTASIDLGELAINTTDGKLFLKKSGSIGESIEQAITTGASNQGTVNLTGSLILSPTSSIGAQNALDVTVQTLDFDFDTLAFNGTSSFTGPYSVTSSAIISGSLEVIGTTTLSGSLNHIGDYTHTGSVYHSGSKILNGVFVQTGSLSISGSTTQIGNNTLFGNTTLSGSIIVSGALETSAPTVKIYGDTQHNGYIRFDPVTTNIDTSISASYIYVSGSTNDLYFSQNGSGYNNVTRLRWLEGNLYTGLLNGGIITTQSSTVYQVSSGSGLVVDLNASYNDNPYPIVTYVNWSNLSASIAPLSASYDQTFVAIQPNGTIGVSSTPYVNGQIDTQIPVGVVLHNDRSTINGVKTQPKVAYGWKQRSNTFLEAFGPLKLSGLTLSVSGSSTGSLVVGSGTAFQDGANYTVDANDPAYVLDTGANVSKIWRYRQSGSDWVYDTNAGAGYGAIDPANYSNSGVLTPVPTNNWSIQRVFYFPNSPVKAIVVYYGNAIYTTELDAIANINIEAFTEAPDTAANAVYLGALVVRHNANFTTAASYKIIPGGLFRAVGGSGGGGGTVTQTLSGLSDVSILSPTNGQPLVYNSTSLKWENSSTLTASLDGNASTATTASFASTASYVLNAVSSSFASTASFVATSSWASNAVSASIAATASLAPNYVLTSVTSSMLAPYVLTSQTSSMSVASASVATSASYALTASFALNGGGTVNTGSLLTTASVSLNTITFTKGDGSTFPITVDTGSGGGGGAAFPFSGSAVISGSLFVSSSTTNVLTIQGSGSAQPIFTVQGSAGQLFAITDSLSGSLFSVNDISGLPILEVFSDNTILLGDYQAPTLYTTKKVTSIAGNNVIYSLTTSSYDGAFFDYVAKSGSNARAGNIMALWSGTSVNFTETTTTDFGDTSGLAFLAFISGSNLVLSGSTSTANWNIKTIIRSI